MTDFSWKIMQSTDMRANRWVMYGSLATLSIVEQPIYRIFYGQGFGGMRKSLRNFNYLMFCPFNYRCTHIEAVAVIV
jgi:hypothetical protein